MMYDIEVFCETIWGMAIDCGISHIKANTLVREIKEWHNHEQLRQADDSDDNEIPRRDWVGRFSDGEGCTRPG